MSSILAVDLDGDGDVDVLATSPTSDKVTWYENSGSPDFTFTAHDIITGVDGASSVFAVDLDGDVSGDVDLLVASADDDTVAWYENDGSENFTKRTIDTGADGASSVCNRSQVGVVIYGLGAEVTVHRLVL